MNPAIYIDDTGSSQQSKSKYDSGNWDSYVAVVLNEFQRASISETIKEIQDYFLSDFGIQELHFTEIFSGKSKYRKFDITSRLKIFDVFADIYSDNNCPIFVQSLTDDDILRNRMEHWRGRKKDGFDFSNNSHFCLWLLLVRLNHDKTVKQFNLPFEIFVDSGKQKPKSFQNVSDVKDITEKAEIQYIDSKSDPLMQFVDFIAFTLNRCRWILMNDKKSEIDIEFLRIAEKADFNAMDMVKKKIEIEKESTTNLYDKILRERFDENGNLRDDEVDKRKE